MIVVFEAPIKVVNELNAHDHWRARARRARMQHMVMRAFLATHAARLDAAGKTLVVTMTRLSPRSYDSDGTVACFKHARDSIAQFLGRDDGPKSGITWECKWERSKVVGIRVEIQEAP